MWRRNVGRVDDVAAVGGGRSGVGRMIDGRHGSPGERDGGGRSRAKG